MKISKSLLSLIIIVGVVGFILCLKGILLRPQKELAKVSYYHSKGNPDAPVKIIEFTDFQCPACSWAFGIMEDLWNKYPEKLYVEFYHFPLRMHGFSEKASIYAECAGLEGKFWDFHDILFKTQRTWSGFSNVDSYFSKVGFSLGLDTVNLTTCVNGGFAKIRVEKSKTYGEEKRVRATPTFFVNGKMAVGGNELKEMVELEISRHEK